MTVEILSRIQFALTSAFHYIYPPISIGLGLLLVIMEGTYLKTKNPFYHKMTRFWVGIFALVFSVGVATGIVLEFQFGTNWARYSRYVGDIFGSALAAEGVFAFFLESGFLAILVFGWNKVSARMHFFATCMVSLGSMFSAVWIIVANSWQQTPAGFQMAPDGSKALITDFWAMVFNPSTIDRLTHTVTGAWLTGAFLVVSISAYYLLKKEHIEFAKSSLRLALTFAAVVSVGQLWLGHQSAIGVAKNQPEKFAAMEGHGKTGEPLSLTVVGVYDEGTRTVKGLTLPGVGSSLLPAEIRSEVKGLDAFAKEELPPVQPVFQSFHIIVGIGILLIVLSVAGSVMAWRGSLERHGWFLKALVGSVFLPQLANMTGWMTAEIGRQPWAVYKLLRTADATSEAVTAGQVLGSTTMFTLVYMLLFAMFIYLLDKKIKAGPDDMNDLEASDFEQATPFGILRRRAGVEA